MSRKSALESASNTSLLQLFEQAHPNTFSKKRELKAGCSEEEEAFSGDMKRKYIKRE